jgi:TolB protein
LARSFELVPPTTYLAPQKEPWTNPVYSNWSNVGASGLVRGAVQLQGHQARVSLKFYDVLSRRELVNRTCTEDVVNASRCVHKFLDEVVLLLTGEEGVFSSRLVFVKRTGKIKSIFTSDIDGGHVERVTDPEVLNLLPAWDPTGKFILFTTYLNGNTDLYRVGLQNKKWEPVSRQPGLNTGASVSPDGKHIAVTLSFQGNTEIYTMDWNGGHLKRLTDSWGQDVSPTWSPDGQRIAFVSTRSGNPHIYAMGADGSNPRRLTFKGTYNQEPDWSPRPDGQIAFTARDEALKYDVFLVNPVNSEITRLTQDDGNNESPSHSPDGQHIVFTSTRQGKQRHVWTMDVDGNNQRAVPLVAGEYETPAWGPRLGYP